MRYKVKDKIGSGAFGEIYRVEKVYTNEVFALKLEVPKKNQKEIMLFWESKILKVLKGKVDFIPNIIFVG